MNLSFHTFCNRVGKHYISPVLCLTYKHQMKNEFFNPKKQAGSGPTKRNFHKKLTTLKNFFDKIVFNKIVLFLETLKQLLKRMCFLPGIISFVTSSTTCLPPVWVVKKVVNTRVGPVKTNSSKDTFSINDGLSSDCFDVSKLQ